MFPISIVHLAKAMLVRLRKISDRDARNDLPMLLGPDVPPSNKCCLHANAQQLYYIRSMRASMVKLFQCIDQENVSGCSCVILTPITRK